MRQTIRQQTAVRSALVRQATRTLPRQPVTPRPLNFLVDGTACTDDTLVYPRTTRQAFGHYATDPLRRDISFIHRAPRGLAVFFAVVAVALILGALQ